jgi:4-amino-4-deoxy-L-arabinose transferase-like glycosyltransferase
MLRAAVAPPTDLAGEEAPLVRAGFRGFLDLDRFDVIAVIALVVFAFGVRFVSPVFPDFLSGSGGVGYWGLGHPYNSGECAMVPIGPNGSEVNHCGYVFDEVYFPVDAAKDLRQPAESYFDPEPPLAKILMTPPMAWWGFDTWTWRASTVFFGSLLVGLIYLIARRLRRDRFFALAAALFLCLDGLAFVESRTGVIDSIAIFFVALFYYTFLLHWQARTKRQWRTTLYAMAAVAGLAFGAKLTALAPLVVASALILARALSPYLIAGFPLLRRFGWHASAGVTLWRNAAGRLGILHYGAAGLVALAIFCGCFSRYLTIEHPDVYRFTDCSQGTTGLVAGPPEVLHVPVTHLFGVAVPDPSAAIHNIIEITSASVQYHQQECHSHPYASHWDTWPVMYHPVLFYYDQPMSGGPASSITDMGNPAVWWPAALALLFCVWKATRGPNLWRLGVAVLGLASLAAMILLFNDAVRYHDPNNVNTSYTAAQFISMVHRDPTPSDEIARIYPSAWFTVAFVGVILFAAAVALSAVISRAFVPAFIVLGYLTAWMMWVPGNERRVLFFYHALGMLLFSVLALAYALTAIRRVEFRVGSARISLAPIAYAVIGAVIAGFIFFYPAWTAVPQTFADHQMRVWVNTL